MVSVLHAANMQVALVAMILIGASMLIVGVLILRVYMADNLKLSAQAISYAVEAAVVFNDQEAASEALSLMSANRPIVTAHVTDRNDEEVARWSESTRNGLWRVLEQALSDVPLMRPTIVEPITYKGQWIGNVTLVGSNRDLLVFLSISMACGLVCLALCAALASRLSRRASRRIVTPLSGLAQVVAKARRKRHFKHRVGPAAIAELQDLGDDFNALLEELERWREQMNHHSESLAYQANHDPLTELANRAHFEARLQDVLGAASEKAGQVALFFVDVDCFKSINDTMGHEVGDVVLKAIAQRLRGQIRETDLVARFGGDEFAALLAPLGDLARAKRIASNMLNSTAKPIELPSGETLVASLSIGIAFYPDHALDAVTLLNKADEAMYHAKRAGRGQYAIAGESVVPTTSEE